jgi:hypothetical protein
MFIAYTGLSAFYGCDARVVRSAGSGDLLAVFACPSDERLDRVEQRGAERGELVVDSRWDDGKHRSGDEAFALELADPEGEHALADPVDLATQFADPARAVGENADDEQRPLVGDPIEDVAELAGGIGIGIAGVPRVTSKCRLSLPSMVKKEPRSEI